MQLVQHSCEIGSSLPIIAIMNAFTPSAGSALQLRFKSSRNELLALIEALPEELLGECANFVVGSLSGLSIFGAVSQSFLASARAVSTDMNAPIWEVILRTVDPILYAGIKQLNAGNRDDAPTKKTWFTRLVRLRQLQMDAAAEALPRILRYGCGGTPLISITPFFEASPGRPAFEVVDVVLHNHPKQGFMINLCEVHRNVCVYGLRMPHRHRSAPLSQIPAALFSPGTSTKLSTVPLSCTTAATTKAKLSRFLLPTYASGAPASLSPTTTHVLVLVSLNGKALSEFCDFEDMVRDIKIAPEFCRWRFLFYPFSELRHAPSECSFGGSERAPNSNTNSVRIS